MFTKNICTLIERSRTKNDENMPDFGPSNLLVLQTFTRNVIQSSCLSVCPNTPFLMMNGLYHNVTYLEVDVAALFGVSYYVL